MKANVRVRPGWLEVPQNRNALLKMFSRNGRYLLTIHEGRITKFAHVPPDQVIFEGGDGEEGATTGRSEA
jgi:hypothetical protein